MVRRSINRKGDEGAFIQALYASTDASELVYAGALEAGLALFNRAIEICPPSEYRNDLHLLRGAALARMGCPEAAIADFDLAVEQGCAMLHEALRRRGNTLAMLGRHEDALADFCQALAEGEDPPYAHQRIIGLLVALGRDDEAAHVPIDGLRGGEKDDSPIRLALVHAELCLLMGDPATAERDVARADAIGRHDSAELALWRAVLRRRLGLDPATDAIRAAMVAAPEHWGTAAFAWLVGGRGDLDAVLATFTARDLPGDRGEIRCLLRFFAGALAEAAGDAAGALRNYRAALAEPDARWIMEYALAERGSKRLDPPASRPATIRRSVIPGSHPTRAAENADAPSPETPVPVMPVPEMRVPEMRVPEMRVPELAEDLSDAVSAPVNAAIDLMREQRHNEAMGILDATLRTLPEAGGISEEFRRMVASLAYAARGACRRYTGDRAAAAADLRRALDRAHDPFEAHLDLFFVLAENGELDGALAELDLLAGEYPGFALGLVLRGALCFAAGDVQGAARAFEAALEEDPDLPHAHHGRALIHLAAAESDAAVSRIAAARAADRRMPEAALAQQIIRQRAAGGPFPVEFQAEFPAEFPGEFPGEFPVEFPVEFPGEFPVEAVPGREPDDYRMLLLEHMAGRVGREAAVAAAATPDASTRRERLTVTHYYLGAVALARGDAPAARREFRSVLELGVPYHAEYGMARLELAALELAALEEQVPA